MHLHQMSHNSSFIFLTFYMHLTKKLILACSISFMSTSVMAQNAAIVNGKPIPKAQLDRLIKNSGQSATDPKIREQGRELLITRELIVQEADKRGVTQKEVILAYLKTILITVVASLMMITKWLMTQSKVNLVEKNIKFAIFWLKKKPMPKH
jgi:hypothetical protein